MLIASWENSLKPRALSLRARDVATPSCEGQHLLGAVISELGPQRANAESPPGIVSGETSQGKM